MNVPKDKLLVNEIFYSIQGEGKHIGYPAIFIRLFGCNNGCLFCDSAYAWNKHAIENNENKERQVLTYKETIKQIQATSKKSNPKHWVITGGEPLLQQDRLIELFQEFKALYKYLPYIEIETNGTIFPKKELDAFVDCYNVSPKLGKSMADAPASTYLKRINKLALTFFKDSNKATFKFVVSEGSDLVEVEQIAREASIPKKLIYLMPLGKNTIELVRNNPLVFNLCLQKGYKFSPRLHIMLFGAKRKV